VMAPFFRIFPSAATLLVAQALLTALSVFPVSQLAREKLGVGPGRAIAIAYAVPLLAFALSALARGHLKAAVWWALPLVFVKEDQGFTVAAIGLYMIIAGLRSNADDRRRMEAGLLLLAWGFAWSFLAIGVIIPHVNLAHHY